MADTLTPERVQEYRDALRKRVQLLGEEFAMNEPTVRVSGHDLETLLLAYQRETCEWRIVGDVGFLTDCGRAPGDEDLYASRPCWCGRKVQVTR